MTSYPHNVVSDELFFERLFDRYAAGLIVYASRITREDHAAEDIVHDVFINMWGKRATIERTGAKSYLFSAVRNECLNHISHRNVKRRYGDSVQNDAGELPGTLTWDYYVESELSSRIEAALDRLTPQQRKIFTMNRFERKTYAQIAEELDISPRTVQKHIELSLRSLRRDLSDYLPTFLLALLLG